MRERAMRLLAAVLALTLLAAGCSDDDPATEAGAEPADEGGDVADPEAMADDMADMADDMADMADHEEHDDAEHDTHDTAEGHGDHDHATAVEITGDVVPTVAVEVVADPSGGVNVGVTTTDFTVNPQAASTEHVEGEGHFHLYLDGEKTLRFYNEWIHVPGVTEGDVAIGVELSANDHRSYAVDGEVIIDTVAFTVPAHSHDSHSHADPVDVEFDGDAPTLTLEVTDDPKSGWNAFVTVDGLTLSPEHASGDHVSGEGHLHIYADGQKLGRLYGGATHIAALPDGEVELRVAAYTNDHNPYVVGGAPVEATTTVTVGS